MAGLDVKLVPLGDKGDLDLVIVDGEFSSVEGLDSSLDVSLLSDRRGREPRVSDPLKARGWIGDTVNGDEIGSHLWLLGSARLNSATVTDAETFASQALQHFIDDGFAVSVDVTGSLTVQGVSLSVTINTPTGESVQKIVNLWELTGG